MTTGRIPPVEGGIQPTIFDAKADLLTATAADVPARLAVGSNGDTLVADSTTTTGLRWQADWNTGKNKIINGDFRINQRAFSSTTTNDTYGFDRWKILLSGGTTYSAQTFTPGTAPVAGYEGINFARVVTTGQSGAGVFSILTTLLEDVRLFAGQTITVSFWAKANSGTPKVALDIAQLFGSGGSAEVNTSGSFVTLTTSWARYSLTVNVPSVSGKTIGAGSSTGVLLWVSAGTDWNTRAASIGIQTNTFDFWGVQAEAGSVATPFTTATGTIQGELAACQRYFVQLVDGITQAIANASAYSASEVDAIITLPVPMRTYPSLVQTTGTDYFAFLRNGGSDTFNSLTISATTWASGSNNINVYNATEISSTAGHGGFIRSNNASARLAASAEL